MSLNLAKRLVLSKRPPSQRMLGLLALRRPLPALQRQQRQLNEPDYRPLALVQERPLVLLPRDTVLLVRHLPFKGGNFPVCDHDSNTLFYVPIRRQLLAAMLPIRPCNTYVPPTGGHALLYFSCKEQADTALDLLRNNDYHGVIYEGDVTAAIQ